MYLSQLILDPRSRGVLKDLADPYQLHRTLMCAFPFPTPSGERVLFRLEQQRIEPQLSILVQSLTPPDWTALGERGYLLRPADVKEFTLEPSSGQIFRFRLLANPTKRLKGNGEKDGPRVGLRHEEDQLAWLERKAEQNGFRVLTAQAAKVSQPDAWKRKENEKEFYQIRCEAVRFDGHLQVTQTAAFAAALTAGIGSGKGFGFGLLSLAMPG